MAATLLKTILSAILKESLAPLRPPSFALLYSSPVFFAQLPKAFLNPVFAFPTWTREFYIFCFFFHFWSKPESSSPEPSPTPWAPRRTRWAEPPSGWRPGCPSARPCWQSRRCRGTGWPWTGPWCWPPRGRGASRRRNAPAGRGGRSESRAFWK